ncbi:uncharacterized protein LOC144065901 isoform X4 [Stigmatopora argus]
MPARTKPTEFQEEHSTVCNVTHEKVVIHIPEGFRNQPPQFEGEEPEFPQDQKREEQLEIKMEEEDVPWSTGEESFKIEEDLGRASGGAEPANTSAWPQIKEEADLPQQQKREDQPPIEKEEDVTWSSGELFKSEDDLVMDLVADLLSKPFSRRTYQEKLDIIKKGRSTPKLASLSQPGKGCVRRFQFANYERYPWLTGSEEHCKLYCWECLLFATNGHGVWSNTGFAHLSCLTKAATRHQSSAGHLQATVLSKTFGETRVELQFNEQVRRETECHNEKVKKNREILKRLIDCVIFLDRLDAHSCWTKSASGVSLVWHQHGGSTHPEWSIQFLRREML